MLSHFKRMDGPWSWFISVLFLTCSLLEYGFVTTYGILFPSILKEFKSPKALTAIPGSLSLAATGLLGLVTGWFCDRFGCRKTMLIGGLMSTIGLVTSSFAPNILVLIVTFGLLLGTGGCAVYVATIAGIPLYFNKYRFQATSIVSIGPGSGLLIMSPVVQNINSDLGWRKSLLCIASFSLIPCLVTLLIRSKPMEENQDSDRIENDVQDLPRIRQSCRLGNLVYFSAFKIKMFLLTTILTVLSSLGHTMPFVHLAQISENINIPSDLSSWLYFTVGLCSTLSRLIIGQVGKLGPLSLPRVFVLGNFILAVGNLYLPYVSSYYALVLYCIGYGIGEGFLFTSSINIVIESVPLEKRGSGFGLFQFCICISFVLAPILSGFIADVTGSYNPAFYIAGSLEALVGFLGFLYRFVPASPKKEPMELELVIIERETVL